VNSSQKAKVKILGMDTDNAVFHVFEANVCSEIPRKYIKWTHVSDPGVEERRARMGLRPLFSGWAWLPLSNFEFCLNKFHQHKVV